MGVCISCCVVLLSFPPPPQVLAHSSKSYFPMALARGSLVYITAGDGKCCVVGHT